MRVGPRSSTGMRDRGSYAYCQHAGCEGGALDEPTVAQVVRGEPWECTFGHPNDPARYRSIGNVVIDLDERLRALEARDVGYPQARDDLAKALGLECATTGDTPPSYSELINLVADTRSPVAYRIDWGGPAGISYVTAGQYDLSRLPVTAKATALYER